MMKGKNKVGSFSFLEKDKQNIQYYYLKKFFILLKQKKIAYPLTGVLLGIVIYGYGYSIIGKQKQYSIKKMSTEHSVLRTTDEIRDFFLTATILIVVFHIPKNSEGFYEFFTTLYPEGNKFLIPLLAMRKNRFWRNLFLCNLCIGSLIGFNAWFYLAIFGWKFYKYIIFRDMEFYCFNVVLLLVLALIRKLELRFSELNDTLHYKTENFLKANASRRHNKTYSTNEDDRNTFPFLLHSDHFYSVRTFRNMHFDLCKLVKTFNDMFGRILLSAVVFNITDLLAKVTFVIDYSLNSQNEDYKSIWCYFLGIVIFWMFANLVQTFLLAFYGEQIAKEGEETTRICFYLLNKVSINPMNDDEKLVQDELKLLVFQSCSRTPVLSAGGFFEINFKLLGLMTSSVTSYLMVIMQFLLRTQNS